jgi:hypothetical protein
VRNLNSFHPFFIFQENPEWAIGDRLAVEILRPAKSSGTQNARFAQDYTELGKG